VVESAGELFSVIAARVEHLINARVDGEDAE
jgi:hypothetical protein